MLKQIVMAACLALSFAAQAADEKKPTPQQQRMADCNKEAGEKKLAGDERKAFMKSCLGGKPAADKSAARTQQQEKMAACNKQAGEKSLKGDERKRFMSECLKA